MNFTFRDIKLFMLFMMNGGVLGLLTYLIQNFLNQFLTNFAEYRNFISSFIVIIPFVFLNFFIQRKIIFRVSGRFFRFVCANFFVLFMISLLTEISFRIYPVEIMFNDFPYHLNFIFVAIVMMPVSFILKRNYVFTGTSAGER